MRGERVAPDYVRRVLRTVFKPRVVRPRTPRSPKDDATVIAALEKCWAVVSAQAGKRLAPGLTELVAMLRGHGELGLSTTRRRCC